MKIKSYAQLKAARAELQKFHAQGHVDADGKVTMWHTKAEAEAYKDLQMALKAAEPIEAKLKEMHETIKATTAPPEVKLRKALQGKAVAINSNDGSSLAIGEYVSSEIRGRAEKLNGMLGQIPIRTLKSADARFVRGYTDPTTGEYEEYYGTAKNDTDGGLFKDGEYHFGLNYATVAVTDEMQADQSADIVGYTLNRLSVSFNDAFAPDMLLGDSASGEMAGMLTDYLDADNSYAIALAGGDENTFAARSTGTTDALGADAADAVNQFDNLVAALPASLRGQAVVIMHPDVLKVYQGFVDSTGQKLFKITKDSFEEYPLVMDENMPVLGDTSKAVVGFGVPSRAVRLGHLPMPLQPNPYQRDGATLYQQVQRLGIAIDDNTAMVFMLAQA